MNGNTDDDYTTSGGIVASVHPFASSWMSATCPQQPYYGPLQPCTFADNTVAKELCQYVGGDLFDKCTGVIEWRRLRTICEYDMCAREDPADNCPLCNALSALAYECHAAGVNVDWQTNAKLRGLCSGLLTQVTIIDIVAHNVRDYCVSHNRYARKY